MSKRRFRIFKYSYGIIIVGLTALAWTMLTAHAETLNLAQLRETTHIHGIAVDPQDSSRIYLATHHGLFLVSPDGQATRISADKNDYMGFTPHPTDSSVLYASGHPVGGGNLGFMISTDGGKTWKQLSEGTRGPVDFHTLAVSKADPKTIYGAYGRLQVSRDGGQTWEPWERLAPLPDGLIDLAASATDANTLYAATQNGLLISKDAGRSWQPAYPAQHPTSLVETGNHGEVYAFMIGVGLLKFQDDGWTLLSEDWGDRYVLHLAVDPTNSDRLYAVLQEGEVLASKDGGRTWTEFSNR
jgi:photosystem II stability/assembly factor-like uncharacterized protein